MMVFAITTFFVSLVGIVALFVLKRWETVHEITVMPQWRSVADYEARLLKARLLLLESEVGTWWPKGILILRYFIHLGALALARTFHRAELMLHRLADRVSHKHRFERRATKSEFLKEVQTVAKQPEPLDIRE